MLSTVDDWQNCSRLWSFSSSLSSSGWHFSLCAASSQSGLRTPKTGRNLGKTLSKQDSRLGKTCLEASEVLQSGQELNDSVLIQSYTPDELIRLTLYELVSLTGPNPNQLSRIQSSPSKIWTTVGPPSSVSAIIIVTDYDLYSGFIIPLLLVSLSDPRTSRTWERWKLVLQKIMFVNLGWKMKT